MENSAHDPNNMTTVNAIRSMTKSCPPWVEEAKKTQETSRKPGDNDQIICYNCRHPSHDRCTIARGKLCNICVKLGHFARACLSTEHIHKLEEGGDAGTPTQQNSGYTQEFPTEEFWYLNSYYDTNSNDASFPIVLEGRKHTVQIDSCAGANVNSHKTYNSLAPSTNSAVPDQTFHLWK